MGLSNEALSSDNKGVYNQLRAKDKELDVAAEKVAEAAEVELRCKVGHCRSPPCAEVKDRAMTACARRCNLGADNARCAYIPSAAALAQRPPVVELKEPLAVKVVR